MIPLSTVGDASNDPSVESFQSDVTLLALAIVIVVAVGAYQSCAGPPR